MNDEIDILLIHSEILNNFRQEEEKIPIYEKRLVDISNIISNDEKISKIISEEIHELEKIINSLKKKNIYIFICYKQLCCWKITRKNYKSL